MHNSIATGATLHRHNYEDEMNKKRLLMLAEYLETKVPTANYNMMNYGMDALYYASCIPEFKKAGLKYTANDNHDPGLRRVWFHKHADIEAAAEFFGLTPFHAQHLFSQHEYDDRGYSQKSPFDCDGARDGGTGRDKEPPAWTAGRIRAYVAEQETERRKAG